MNHADLVEAGKLIAQSEMFGKINPSSGYMIASLCYQEGISYLDFAETYNWMHNSASMKADAMLARFCDRGGKYVVVTRTPEKAEITIEFQGRTSSFGITWEEVKEEPFVFKNDGKTIKANYATPRKRMQSLWSRAVSDAVHTVCPQACKGSYTAEEAETFVTDDDSAPRTAPAPITAAEAARRVQEAGSLPPAEPDYTICPEGFGDLSGFSWSEMDDSTLEAAFDSKNPGITDKHKTAIVAVIERRK